jgi:hypothetical protein
MDVGLWLPVWLLVACVVLAGIGGLVQDRRHPSKREGLLNRSTYDVRRAQQMSSYYASNHGTEW